MTQRLESAMTERDASYGLRYLQEASKASSRVDSLARAKADAIELHERGFMSASAKASTVAGVEHQQVAAEVQKESRTRVLHDYVEGLAKHYGDDVYGDFQRIGEAVGSDFAVRFANEMAFMDATAAEARAYTEGLPTVSWRLNDGRVFSFQAHEHMEPEQVAELMFSVTNIPLEEFNVDGPYGPYAKEWATMNHRSLSVGDSVTVDDMAYTCESAGWELSEESTTVPLEARFADVLVLQAREQQQQAKDQGMSL